MRPFVILASAVSSGAFLSQMPHGWLSASEDAKRWVFFIPVIAGALPLSHVKKDGSVSTRHLLWHESLIDTECDRPESLGHSRLINGGKTGAGDPAASEKQTVDGKPDQRSCRVILALGGTARATGRGRFGLTTE